MSRTKKAECSNSLVQLESTVLSTGKVCGLDLRRTFKSASPTVVKSSMQKVCLLKKEQEPTPISLVQGPKQWKQDTYIYKDTLEILRLPGTKQRSKLS